jgi:hypothetical protein
MSLGFWTEPRFRFWRSLSAKIRVYRANFGRTDNCDRGIYQRPCILAIAQQEYFVLGANQLRYDGPNLGGCWEMGHIQDRSWTQVATSRCMHLIDAPKEEGEYDFVG